ncbi:unnamed protein product, partial [Lymnaea stagnalis]
EENDRRRETQFTSPTKSSFQPTNLNGAHSRSVPGPYTRRSETSKRTFHAVSSENLSDSYVLPSQPDSVKPNSGSASVRDPLAETAGVRSDAILNSNEPKPDADDDGRPTLATVATYISSTYTPPSGGADRLPELQEDFEISSEA